MQGLNNYRLVVTIGSHDVTLGINYYPIWWISYDNWCKRFNIALSENNDIAILKVNCLKMKNI
jgi:hypothetical protein